MSERPPESDPPVRHTVDAGDDVLAEMQRYADEAGRRQAAGEPRHTVDASDTVLAEMRRFATEARKAGSETTEARRADDAARAPGAGGAAPTADGDQLDDPWPPGEPWPPDDPWPGPEDEADLSVGASADAPGAGARTDVTLPLPSAPVAQRSGLAELPPPSGPPATAAGGATLPPPAPELAGSAPIAPGPAFEPWRPPVRTAKSAEPSAPPPAPPNRWKLVALALAVAVVVLGAVLVFGGGSGDETPSDPSAPVSTPGSGAGTVPGSGDG